MVAGMTLPAAPPPAPPPDLSRALILGQGSIGRRHARLLAARGLQVAAVSRQGDTGIPVFADVATALRDWRPGYAVVATATADHATGVAALARAGFSGRLLVEKPLALGDAPLPGGFDRVGVAFNLRFHPVLGALKARLAGAPARLVTVHCGQHLADWRPGRDFRATYSADAGQGGGVLRDLSHDLNYLEWLAGPAVRVAATGGNLGLLGIKADEAWSILVETAGGARCSVTLNYLDRPARRQIAVTTDRETLVADLIAGTLAVDGVVSAHPADRDATYVAMHDAMLGAGDARLCSLAEAQSTDRLIGMVERAAAGSAWVAA